MHTITTERRAACRLEVLDQLNGQLVSMNVPILVRELGAGGFSIESNVPFPIGAHHQFRFTTAAGLAIILEAAVVHSQPTRPAHGWKRYVTGFSFVHDAIHDTARDIDILLDAMTAVLQFE